MLNNGLRNTKYSNHKLNLVLFQPELSDFYMKGGSKINDEEIIDKKVEEKVNRNGLKDLCKERISPQTSS